MMNLINKSAYVSIFFFGVFVNYAMAQQGMSNARSVAMGGAYIAIAGGVESPAWNPANLGLSGKKKYRLNLISVGVGLHNNSFTTKHYNLYNGSYLSEEDKQDIMNSIPAEGLLFNVNSEVQALGFSFGSFAFTASGLAASDFSLSRDVADLILNGNDFERVYNIGDTDGEGWGISSFAISTGFRLPLTGFQEFAIGASAKYLRGFAYAKVKEATSTIMTDIDGMHGRGRVVIDHSLGGNGLAFDVGAAAHLSQNWTVSLGVSNLINYINWNSETKRFTYEFTADSVSVEKIDDTDIDSVIVDTDETVDIDPFTTKLPSQLRFGIARSTKRLTFGLDFTQGLKKSPASTTKPRMALGTELRLIKFLPLRTGVSIGGKKGFSSSAGFGLDFSAFSWDFAMSYRGGMFSGKGLGFAFDWMFRL